MKKILIILMAMLILTTGCSNEGNKKENELLESAEDTFDKVIVYDGEKTYEIDDGISIEITDFYINKDKGEIKYILKNYSDKKLSLNYILKFYVYKDSKWKPFFSPETTSEYLSPLEPGETKEGYSSILSRDKFIEASDIKDLTIFMNFEGAKDVEIEKFAEGAIYAGDFGFYIEMDDK